MTSMRDVFAAPVAPAAAVPEPILPVPDSTIATLEPVGFNYDSMCCRNNSDPSETRGRPAPKRP